MKMNMKKIIILISIALSASASQKLKEKIEALSIPQDKVTPILSEDKLYVVNTRYSSLKFRHEFTISGANNFLVDDHLTSRQLSGSYRFHFNDTFSAGYRYSDYNNELSTAGKRLFEDKDILPDTDYAIKAWELFVNANVFYGKIRLSEKRIVYFDLYTALGAGKMELASGEVDHYIGDVGIAFWLGRNFSTRIGYKTEFYEQESISGIKQDQLNGLGYIEIGYLFGSGSRL